MQSSEIYVTNLTFLHKTHFKFVHQNPRYYHWIYTGFKNSTTTNTSNNTIKLNYRDIVFSSMAKAIYGAIILYFSRDMNRLP